MIAVEAAIQGANTILFVSVTRNGSFDRVKAHGAKRPSLCGDAVRRVNPRSQLGVNVWSRTSRAARSCARSKCLPDGTFLSAEAAMGSE
jgi:hypothetical protein